MAAVRSLMVAVKSEGGSDRSCSGSDSDSDHDAREAEPMEVEEGELETEDVSVNRSLKELLPVSGGPVRPGTRVPLAACGGARPPAASRGVSPGTSGSGPRPGPGQRLLTTNGCVRALLRSVLPCLPACCFTLVAACSLVRPPEPRRQGTLSPLKQDFKIERITVV